MFNFTPEAEGTEGKITAFVKSKSAELLFGSIYLKIVRRRSQSLISSPSRPVTCMTTDPLQLVILLFSSAQFSSVLACRKKKISEDDRARNRQKSLSIKEKQGISTEWGIFRSD